jgi:glutamine amidotransferase
MQALFERSEEDSGIMGLSILKGGSRKLRSRKVPQIGWNIVQPKGEGTIARDWYYFANSFVVQPEDQSIINGTTRYDEIFTSSIRSENIWGVQFHPEKSGESGLRFLRRWMNC